MHYGSDLGSDSASGSESLSAESELAISADLVTLVASWVSFGILFIFMNPADWIQGTQVNPHDWQRERTRAYGPAIQQNNIPSSRQWKSPANHR